MMKKITAAILILILFVCLFFLVKIFVPGSSQTTQKDLQESTETITKDNTDGSSVGMANPASVYCKEQGGSLSIRKDLEGNEYGVCVFEDGSECDEWKYFRKECDKGIPNQDLVSDPEKDKTEIEQALVREEGISLDEMVVTVRENTGKYASGGMRPKEPGVGGAYFFAAKTSAGWTIVAAGNGTITCEDVAPYPDLPVSMISECYDVPTETLIKR